MCSGSDDLPKQAGLPHSEISGSKPVCRLPEAYRRLPRPSSPPTAKASTVCAYSLDHITPTSLESQVSWSKRHIPKFRDRLRRLSRALFTAFRIVKEQAQCRIKSAECLGLNRVMTLKPKHSTLQHVRSWWSQAGSNRRPPACKAGALPAELWPLRVLVGLGGVEPPTSPLSGVRSNQLSYRPKFLEA